MITLASLRDIDFVAAVGLFGYALAVASCKACAGAAALLSPEVAFAAGTAAAVRWAARLDPKRSAQEPSA